LTRIKYEENYEEPLSNFSFNVNLRRYTEGEMAPDAMTEMKAKDLMTRGLSFDSLLDGPDEGRWVGPLPLPLPMPLRPVTALTLGARCSTR
jgi:hypothetical protein